jgi:hypothetical protein
MNDKPAITERQFGMEDRTFTGPITGSIVKRSEAQSSCEYFSVMRPLLWSSANTVPITCDNSDRLPFCKAVPSFKVVSAIRAHRGPPYEYPPKRFPHLPLRNASWISIRLKPERLSYAAAILIGSASESVMRYISRARPLRVSLVNSGSLAFAFAASG